MTDISTERRAIELFEALLGIDEAERDAWIAKATRGDKALAQRLARLIEADEANMLRTGGAVDEAAAAVPPERIGAYRLTELIGTGGMGSVYAAIRDRGDFEHEVAIKLIKPGLLTNRLAERFSRERQMLAQFSHPNIARLYDGGETAEGLPYIVMEKIDGVGLATWLDKASPSLAERIGLFVRVCDAAAYAHRNLVIHRDLSPSNVLVTPAGEPKLIDFGIAKPADPFSSDTQPAETSLASLSLTPGYAAPERMVSSHVSIAADIYSLGKLFDLLLGKGTNEPELSAIVERATAPDPGERYPTVEALAADIEAWRNRRPVAAYGQSAQYQARKFFSRNRLGVALGAAALIALVTGVVLLADAWRSAAQQRDAAEARFAELRALSNFLIFDLYDELAQNPGNTAALNSVADKAREYLDRLSRTPGASAGLRLETALAYQRLSDVLGSPRGDNLGRREEAQEALETSLGQLRKLRAEYPQRADVSEGLADVLVAQQAFAFIALDDTDLAIEAGNEAAELYRALSAQGHKPAEMFRARLSVLGDVGVAHGWTDTPLRGVAIIRVALDSLAELEDTSSWSSANLELRAKLRTNLFETLTLAADAGVGDYEEAIALSASALADYETLLARNYLPDRTARAMMITLYKRALALAGVGRERQSLPDLARAEAIGRDLLRRDEDNQGVNRLLTSVLGQYASALSYSGENARAAQKAREVLQRKRTLAESEPGNSARRRELAATLIVTGEVAERGEDRGSACRQYGEARSLYDQLLTEDAVTPYDREVVFADLPERVQRTC